MGDIKQQTLKNFGLRSTPSRSAILDLFLSCAYALSYSDMEKKLAPNFDRVTVYRTLKTFAEKGIIHKILNDTGTPKYALCGENCSTAEHHHNHVHFKCDQCGNTHCLDDITIPTLTLPQGYRIATASLLIQGVCDHCS